MNVLECKHLAFDRFAENRLMFIEEGQHGLPDISRRVVHDCSDPVCRFEIRLPATLSGQETAIEAATAVGNVILVMQSGSSYRKEVANLVEKLKQRRVNVIAAVVTDVPVERLEQRVVDHSDKQSWSRYPTLFNRVRPPQFTLFHELGEKQVNRT